VQRGRYLHCNGSHLSIFDDPQAYFEGMIQFVDDVDAIPTRATARDEAVWYLDQYFYEIEAAAKALGCRSTTW